jgi:hypothetical protein
MQMAKIPSLLQFFPNGAAIPASNIKESSQNDRVKLASLGKEGNRYLFLPQKGGLKHIGDF